MPFIPLRFKPGLNRDQSNYSNEGGWWACDKIRFRSGYPEKIGGWTKYTVNTVLGTCRALFNWVTSYADNMLATGTDQKVYIEVGGNYNDITPLRTTTTNAATFTASNGSSTVTVTDSGSNPVAGAYVTFSGATALDDGNGGVATATPTGTSTGTATFTGITQDSTSGSGTGAEFTISSDGAGNYTIDAITDAGADYAVSDTLTVLGTSLGGATPANDLTITVDTILAGNVTAAILNANHQIATAINSDAYTIVVSVTANSADTAGDGGGSVTAAYQITPGNPGGTYGYGWGTGTWGRGTMGSGSTQPISLPARLWFFDNFDNDLVLNYRDGLYGIPYIWERGGTTDPTSALATPAILLSDLSGASDVPTYVGQLLVSQNDKHLLAFGATPYGGGDFDPLLIRWASQDAPEDWTPEVTNSAGFIRVSKGSIIRRAIATRQEILIFTDTGLNSLQFTGTADVFALQELNNNISLMGPNAIATANGIVFWMGRDKFYAYTGRVETLPTTLWTHVFRNFNYESATNVYAGTNEGFNEIWWFYASANSAENDSYVVYNYVEQIWYYGTIERTAWVDSGLREYPQGIDSTGQLYDHEDGNDADGVAMDSYIQSADFDIGDGEKFMMSRRILPDIKFTGSTASSPEAYVTVAPRRFPGASPQVEPNLPVIESSVDVFTDQVFIRARGRSMAFKVGSNTTGVQWQLGNPRLDAREDGRR